MKGESSGLRRMDWVLVAAAAGLVLIGTVAVMSAASPMPRYTQILQRHFLALALGALAFVFGTSFNYQIYQDQARILYGVMIAMMAAVLIVGETVRGHRSWIHLPYFSFQPSEMARVCTVLVLANYLDRREKQIERLSTALGALAIVLPVVGLIILQPDFSSALIFFPVLASMLFCAGASLAQLAALTAFGAVTGGLLLLWTLSSLHPEIERASAVAAYAVRLSRSGGLLALTVGGAFAAAYLAYRALLILRFRVALVHFVAGAAVLSSALCAGVLVNRHIKYYQRNRFISFLAPEADPQEAGYNVNQALVAIGSGGVSGKGIFSGTQAQLGFLPERHTDFIFAVIGEEMGFLGAASVLGLYVLLLSRVVRAALAARDRYGYLVCCGIASMFGFYVLVNVGMCLGLLPVAGIPLPLISYGGSSLVASLWAVGVVSSVHSKRYAFI